MACRVFLLVAACVTSGAAALADMPEDHVPLVQRTAQGKVFEPGSTGEETAPMSSEVLMGLVGAMRLQNALVDFLFPKIGAATELVEAFPWATPLNWSTEANAWGMKPAEANAWGTKPAEANAWGLKPWNWTWPWSPAALPAATKPAEAKPAAASQKPLPLAEENMCTAADRAHSKAKIMEYVSMKKMEPPASCPSIKEFAQVLKSLNNLGPCVAELLDISPGCADCHQALLANLPSCLPTCGASVFSCPFKLKGSPPQQCWSAVGRCLSCASPFYIQNFKCTGDVPKAAFKLIDEFVADVSDGSIANNGTVITFLAHAVQALR